MNIKDEIRTILIILSLVALPVILVLVVLFGESTGETVDVTIAPEQAPHPNEDEGPTYNPVTDEYNDASSTYIDECRARCESNDLVFMGVELGYLSTVSMRDSRCLCYVEELMYPE